VAVGQDGQGLAGVAALFVRPTSVRRIA